MLPFTKYAQPSVSIQSKQMDLTSQKRETNMQNCQRSIHTVFKTLCYNQTKESCTKSALPPAIK